ncbi:protein phosphatase 2C domain-containing protein [Micromonospora narathiwatensis]|uniref:Protein phosphatase 2C n=1 Tax=Micromonospora narathiwatensis TaxID=299146 RepID=A0A1A8ZL70_9ACTN|nr:protein phosphatase 2C domain-containing protein [Micromonospora narathiwatensis]SBT44594.1 Protein phosphatase 2C [Micromonospora narathiwatensis]
MKDEPAVKVRALITTAGGARANEDRAGHRGTLAWVIDGATDLYQDGALPADSDVQWLVDTVDQHLTSAGADGYRGAAATLLDIVADDVARQQRALGFPTGRVPPACSIALCVDQGLRYDISRVGDATAVVAGREPAVLATGYFDRREAAAVEMGEADPQRVIAAMHERRLHTMTSGDTESVFSGHPRRQLRPHSVAGTWVATDTILLCTDGFARLVTDYGLYQEWADVITDAIERGLPYLEALIRQAEDGAAGGGRRFKRADDVAAVLLTRN